jgi:HSP20 family protein
MAKPAKKQAVAVKRSSKKVPAKRMARGGAGMLPGIWEHPESLFSRLAQMRSDMDSMFELMTRGLGFPQFRLPQIEMPKFAESTIADVRFEVSESDKAFEVVAELPGLEEKDVEVTLANSLLTVRGEKQDTREQTEKDFVVSERRYGSFERSFRVPEGIDEDKVASRFENGVLTLTLPKLEAVQARTPRKIEIKKA